MLQAHRDYLHALTQAAWQDGVVTEAERSDLHVVAGLLGLSGELVEDTVNNEADGVISDPPQPALRPAIGGLTLQPGDKIVLTGDMTCPRRDWVERATAAGLQITTSVGRKTRVLVAADPDSLSGKANDARRLGVPVVGETAFARAIETMTTE